MQDTITVLSTEAVPNKARTLRQIKHWFEKAVPQPTERNIHTQIGVHVEEVAEMFTALIGSGQGFKSKEELSFAADVLNYVQRRLKSQDDEVRIRLKEINRIEVLDALCDQIVTAVGIAHMLGMDIEGALQEVANSNDSKFGADGQPIFDENQKITKGPGYFRPDLTKYT